MSLLAAPGQAGKGVYRFTFEYRVAQGIRFEKFDRIFSVTKETVDRLINADLELLQVIAYMTQPKIVEIRNLTFEQLR